VNKSTVAFIGGVYAGFLITAFLMLIFLVDPIKKEAIKRGFAEMKLNTPYDTEATFTWKGEQKSHQPTPPSYSTMPAER
jgi:hypothetical protein